MFLSVFMIVTSIFYFVGKLKLQEIIPPCLPCCHLTGLKKERPTDTSYNYCKTSRGKMESILQSYCILSLNKTEKIPLKLIILLQN